MVESALGFFDRVYIINLKSRADRREEMADQLARIGLSFNSPNVQLWEASRPAEAAGFTSVGTHGCFMSHLRVLRDARDRGLKSVLILEDDFNFSPDFLTLMPQVQRQLSRSVWGMFYGCYTLYGEPPALSEGACAQVEPRVALGTTACVAVHGLWLQPLIDYLEAMLRRPAGDPAGGPMHVDGAYCWFRAHHPNADTFIANQPLGYQRSSQTDVHVLPWFDRVQPVASVVALLRKLRNRMRRQLRYR